ncbi:REP-associated tyrosine transposase [Pseudomonas schmalbachii]|uniref:Transposase n=1 Tax=Pseudomonas schmalbachii TaxID=2816993 RepID=A0ABS3TSU6_9PSED|nr:transposase [Pseudomonas schmalbachii]MBO3276732.1 transposase [Pseudomonas schmalbachii]
MRYRRTLTPGATYFFTVNLEDRSQHLLVEHITILRAVTRQVKATHPFEIRAMVVLPEHIHAIWTLPEGDENFPTRWSLIKSGFSRHLPRTETINRTRHNKRERGIWQRRYWEHRIRDEEDLQRHVDYIHFNPVKHGHAPRAMDWPYSSIHRYIRQGLLPADWGSNEETGSFGERQ